MPCGAVVIAKIMHHLFVKFTEAFVGHQLRNLSAQLFLTTPVCAALEAIGSMRTVVSRLASTYHLGIWMVY